MPKIYLAGPDVFRLDAYATLAAKKQQLEEIGWDVFTPLDIEEQWHDNDPKYIAYMNMRAIENCDIVLADVQPFRGTEPDSGTVFEIGFAVAKEKIVVTYNNPEKSYLNRLDIYDTQHLQSTFQPEAFGLKQNLMLSCSAWFECADFEEAVGIIGDIFKKGEFK